MQRLLLVLAYYLVVTPVGKLATLVRDPLARSWDRQASSYWIRLDRS